MTSRRIIWCLGALLSIGLFGCQPPMASVSGRVTLDGQPLAEGAIEFVPEDGKTASAGGIVSNGTYRLEMPPGKKVVRLTAKKVVGKRQVYEGDPQSPVMDIVTELLPPRYNAESTLTKEVVAGENEAHFELTTK